MVKRKRSLQKIGNANPNSKRRRSKQIASSDFSEVDDSNVEAFIEVEKAPPKSKVKTSQLLTFPMGQNPYPLPDCEGPKLEPFSHGDVHVRFVREIGDNAVHSNVFEVEIQDKLYALKLFRTFSGSWFPKRECWPPGAYPGPKDLANHFRPFYRECRAYGCINASSISHRYWRCYGYLKLPSHLRNKLCDITGLPHHYWQTRPPEFGRTDKPTLTKSGELSWPIYAVVKELAPWPSAEIDPKQRSIRSMLTDLRYLHKIGVVNSDIADRNYIAGRVIDFSSAFTLPNLWFHRLEGSRRAYYPHTFEQGAHSDMWRLRDMINASGIKTKAVLPAGPQDGSVFTRTRARRIARVNHFHFRENPFYELGVNEPVIKRPRRSSSYS